MTTSISESRIWSKVPHVPRQCNVDYLGTPFYSAWLNGSELEKKLNHWETCRISIHPVQHFSVDRTSTVIGTDCWISRICSEHSYLSNLFGYFHPVLPVTRSVFQNSIAAHNCTLIGSTWVIDFGKMKHRFWCMTNFWHCGWKQLLNLSLIHI